MAFKMEPAPSLDPWSPTEDDLLRAIVRSVLPSQQQAAASFKWTDVSNRFNSEAPLGLRESPLRLAAAPGSRAAVTCARLTSCARTYDMRQVPASSAASAG